MLVGYAIAGVLVPMGAPAGDSPSPWPLVAVCLLNSAVLTYLALRARFGGIRLAATLLVVLFGMMTFMAQIESAFFLDEKIPDGMLGRIFAMGAIVSLVVAPPAVLVFGRFRERVSAARVDGARLKLPRADWAWKIALISLLYLVLYFGFGYFVAWLDPELRAYYGGADPSGFLPHMAQVAADSPWLLAFQVVRSWLWTLLAVPMVLQIRHGWVEPALAVGCAFAILMNAQLLLPNPDRKSVV